MRSALVNVPVRSPPQRGREHDVGQGRGLGRVGVGDHHEDVLGGEDLPDPAQVRHRHRRVGAGDPQEVDRPLLGVAEQLHRVRGRRPVRDGDGVDVPQLGELVDVGLVVPVAEPGQVAVGAALPVVLRGRLPVHLQHARARTADHPAQQVQVVHADGRRRGLVGLVEALQHRRQRGAGVGEEVRRGLQVGRVDPADLAHPGRVVGLHHRGQLVVTDRVCPHPVVVDGAPVDQRPGEPVDQGDVRTGPDRQVHRRAAGHLGAPRVDADQRRRVGPVEPVEHPRPQHGLGLGDVVSEQEQRVAVLDVVVTARLPVGAETLLHRRRRGRRAQPGVAVHVRGPEPGLPDDAERVVLLGHQLAGGVEAVREPAAAFQQRAGPLDDRPHRGVVVDLDQVAVVVAQQRLREPVPVGGLPAVEALGAQPATVDPVVGAATDPDDLVVDHSDVQAAPVAAQHAGRTHPALHVLGPHPVTQVLVHPLGPGGARRVRGARAPRVPDAVVLIGHPGALPGWTCSTPDHPGQRPSAERSSSLDIDERPETPARFASW